MVLVATYGILKHDLSRIQQCCFSHGENFFQIQKTQCSPQADTCKSEILDMVYAMRSFQNVNKVTLKDSYKVMLVKQTSST